MAGSTLEDESSKSVPERTLGLNWGTLDGKLQFIFNTQVKSRERLGLLLMASSIFDPLGSGFALHFVWCNGVTAVMLRTAGLRRANGRITAGTLGQMVAKREDNQDLSDLLTRT